MRWCLRFYFLSYFGDKLEIALFWRCHRYVPLLQDIQCFCPKILWNLFHFGACSEFHEVRAFLSIIQTISPNDNWCVCVSIVIKCRDISECFWLFGCDDKSDRTPLAEYSIKWHFVGAYASIMKYAHCLHGRHRNALISKDNNKKIMTLTKNGKYSSAWFGGNYRGVASRWLLWL